MTMFEILIEIIGWAAALLILAAYALSVRKQADRQ